MDSTSIAWVECLVPATRPPDALRDEIAAIVGRSEAASYLPYLAPVPWLARAKARLGLGHMPIAFVSRELADMISLVVSQDHSCRYCYGATRAYLQVLGHREADIDRLERDFEVDGLAERDRLALGYARKLSRANPRVMTSDWRALGIDRGHEEIVEISTVVAVVCWLTRVSTLLALPPVLEEPIRSWPSAVVQGLLARIRKRPRYALDEPVHREGLGSELIAALGRAPLAAILGQCLDEMLASTALPLETKLVMLAVTGRALGCNTCEREVRNALAPLGIAAHEVPELVARLGAPRLDERDRRLVALARDAVFISDPAPIQRKVRDATEGLTPEEKLEAVGVIAMANLLARVSVVLECP